jgi:phage host-nuclease inhibitor protein Gam
MNLLQKDELQDWQWDAEGQEQEVLQQRFVIENLSGLNWAFRKLAAIRAKNTEIDQLIEREMDRIKAWEESQKAHLKQDAEFFEGLIQQYHAKQLQADPKAKTISTPYGTCSSRASKASVDKADAEALLQYAKENNLPEFIKVKEEVKWAELKKTLKVVEVGESEIVVDREGQVVPGAVVKPASVSFKVEVL